MDVCRSWFICNEKLCLLCLASGRDLTTGFATKLDTNQPDSDFEMRDINKPIFSASRYLDDLLNIDNPYFEGMVNLYPPELQLNKVNASDTEVPFLDYIYLFLMPLFQG